MIQACYFIPLEVLVSNGEPQPGAVSFLEMLEEERMPYVILTEQSSRFRDQIAYYLIDRGFHYIRLSHIYTSTMATLDYLHHTYHDKKKIAAIGSQGMLTTIQQSGYTLTFDEPDFVLAGMSKEVQYDDYSALLQAILSCGRFYSIDDRKVQRTDGLPGIGNGAVVKMLEYASNVKPLSFGKGSKGYLTMTCRYMKVPPTDVLYVGNDFHRDIIPATRFGMNTVLISQGRDLTHIGMTEEIHPDFIVNDLYGLTK